MYSVAILSLVLGASALNLPRSSCTFGLTASGGQSGTIGQLSDGQNRIGGGLTAANFTISNGSITDSAGRGCILTDEVEQFQCDEGKSPASGFAIESNGILTSGGSSVFYACPASETEWNLYTTPVVGQKKCVEIELTASGCGAVESSSTSVSVSTTTVTSISTVTVNNCEQTSAAVTSGTPAVVESSTTAVVESTTPVVVTSSTPAVLTSSTVAVVESTTTPVVESTTPVVVTSSTPAIIKTSVPATSTIVVETSSEEASTSTTAVVVETLSTATREASTSSPIATSSSTAYTTSTTEIIETQTSSSIEAVSTSQIANSSSAESITIASTPLPSATPKYSNTTTTATTFRTFTSSSVASSASSASTCSATTLTGSSTSGNYQYPHLVIPISSESPTTAAGSQYYGTISSNTSTIFNFDIPSSYSGHTCNLIFLLPLQSELETSSYTFSGSGAVEFEQLSSVATEGTTYDNTPSVSADLGEFTLTEGSSTLVSTFACQAGETVAYEISAVSDTYLYFFQDWNPSPLGLYITVC